jgi:micrococcal nuclease
VVVEGKIVAAKNTGRACFLNFHRNWKRYFTAVIVARRFERFPAPPETLYLGHTARVTGRVRDYRGKPEIVIDSPDQIRILDAAASTD